MHLLIAQIKTTAQTVLRIVAVQLRLVTPMVIVRQLGTVHWDAHQTFRVHWLASRRIQALMQLAVNYLSMSLVVFVHATIQVNVLHNHQHVQH